jgi:hypothetical protein
LWETQTLARFAQLGKPGASLSEVCPCPVRHMAPIIQHPARRAPSGADAPTKMETSSESSWRSAIAAASRSTEHEGASIAKKVFRFKVRPAEDNCKAALDHLR